MNVLISMWISWVRSDTLSVCRSPLVWPEYRHATTIQCGVIQEQNSMPINATGSCWHLCCLRPVSHDRVSPMKNPPRGGNIILCKSLSPYANLAYPMTKSLRSLKLRRSRRDTIAPREIFAPAARLIAYWTMVSQHGSDGVSCYKETEVDCGWSNTTSSCMVSDLLCVRRTTRRIRNGQWLDAASATSVTRWVLCSVRLVEIVCLYIGLYAVRQRC